MQACAFLASFEPRQALAIHIRLGLKFPDHFPDDPHHTEAIYDAALYALVWQRAVPRVYVLREVPSPSAPSPVTSGSLQLPPTSIYAFPLVSQSLSPAHSDTVATTRSAPAQKYAASLVSLPRDIPQSPAPTPTIPAPFQFPPLSIHAFPHALDFHPTTHSDPATAICAPSWEGTASCVLAPRDVPPTPTPTLATSAPNPTPPPPVRTFPPVLRFMQAETPVTAPAHVPQHPAPLAQLPREVPTRFESTLATSAPAPTLSPIVHAVPATLEAPQPAQPDPIFATLDVLAITLANLKEGLEAFLINPESSE